MPRTVNVSSNSADSKGDAKVIDAGDLAQYIADMSGEMAVLAKRAGWPLVTYFLEMAQIQAQERLRQQGEPSPAPSPSRRRRNGR